MDKKIKLVRNLAITYFFLIIICCLIYTLILTPPSQEDKISSIIGLLGWSAAIFAPISAFFLLNSWKEQTKYNAKLELVADMVDELSKLSLKINDVRSDIEVSAYLYRMFFGNKIVNEICDIPKLEIPNFSEIFECLENIRVINLKIFLYDHQINSHVFMKRELGRDSFEKIEADIKGLEACFFIIKHNKTLFKNNNNSSECLEIMQKCFYINENFYNNYRANKDPSSENKYHDKLNVDLNDAFNDLKNFRKSLN